MKYIINENRLKELVFNYLNENETINKIKIVDGGNYLSFITKETWDNRYEKTPIVFNYHKFPSKLDIGAFWGNEKNYPILNIDPNLYDELEGLFGEVVNKFIPEWFEIKYNLPVETFNYEFN